MDYWQWLTVAGRLHSAEAIATVYGLVTTGYKGDRCVNPALRAHDWMHLSWRPVGVSATSLLAPASPTTLGTPTWFICKSLGSEELLLPSREDEIVPALYAG